MVLPPLSGECPACGMNTNDITGTDPSRTSLSIGHGEVLPPYCCDCGNKTDRKADCSEFRESSIDDSSKPQFLTVGR